MITFTLLPIAENSITLLVANVRMENEDKESFHAHVKTYNPDILLINEPDQAWTVSISKLDAGQRNHRILAIGKTHL